MAECSLTLPFNFREIFNASAESCDPEAAIMKKFKNIQALLKSS
jgi:hypothetical protein